MVEGLAELGRARRLADTALRTCAPDDRSLVRLADRLPAALVVRRPEPAGELVQEVLGPLLELDPAEPGGAAGDAGRLLAAEGSAERAATRLYCHRNTAFNRLRRLEHLTSRSLSRPHDLIALTLARDARRLTADRLRRGRERGPVTGAEAGPEAGPGRPRRDPEDPPTGSRGVPGGVVLMSEIR